MRQSKTSLTAIVVAAAVATPAFAVDFTVLGTKLVLNDRGNRSKLVFVSKDPLIEVPVGAPGPDEVGATLTVLNPITGREASVMLPAPFWKVNRSGTRYTYNDGAIKVKLRNRRLLRVKAQSTIIPLLGQPQETISIVFEFGDTRYCARFDPFSVKKDGNCVFKAKRSTAPLTCPDAVGSPSGAFLMDDTRISHVDGAEDPSGPDTVTLPGNSMML